MTGALVTALLAGRAERPDRHSLAVGAILAVAPDLDFAANLLGDSAPHWMSHRGPSHSVAVALMAGGVAGLGAAAVGRDAVRAASTVAACVASHGLLDLLTDTDLGVALLWPLSDIRFRSPVRPILSPPMDAIWDIGRWARAIASELALVAPAAWARWGRRRAWIRPTGDPP